MQVDRYFGTCPQNASLVKQLSSEHGEKYTVSAHHAAMKGVENVANSLGGCARGRLYICWEPNGDMKSCVFFGTSQNTVLGNILKDSIEQVWDMHPLLRKLRSRERLEDYQR